MNTTTFLQKQLSNINSIFQDLVGDLSDREWVSHGVPGQNVLGFTAWHIPRTQDNFVQTWIRGIPELAHADGWKHWQPFRPFGIGVGATLDQADKIARSIRQADVLAYADAVHREMLDWLRRLDEAELDRVPDTVGHLSAFPEYQTPAYHEQTDDLLKQSMAGILMRPCIGHIHRHLGEMETLKNILRGGK